MRWTTTTGGMYLRGLGKHWLSLQRSASDGQMVPGSRALRLLVVGNEGKNKRYRQRPGLLP